MVPSTLHSPLPRLDFRRSGWGKITAIDTVVKFFQDLNLPLPIFQAHLVAYTELIAGLLLIFGLFTRYAAIPLIVTMVVAIIKVAARDVEQVSGIIATSEFLYITLMIWLVVKGAGECSLDEYLRKKFR